MAILDQPPVRGVRSGALEQVRAALPDLRPAERRVAEHIIADPGQAIALSIGEFAAACGVAQPTVSRLCRSAGFPSYAALRLGLANDFGTMPSTSQAAGGLSSFPYLIDTLRATPDMPAAAAALRTAARVEVWPAPDLAHAGALLADRLAGLAVPAACATVPAHWSTRAAGLPPRAVVILLSSTSDDTSWSAGLTAARGASAQVLWCTARPAARGVQGADWLIALPGGSSPELVGLALVEALTAAVQDASGIAGPTGPASPWRPWPHIRAVFLPTAGDPIPAILLAHDDQPRPRPLVLYFSGMTNAKENALPGIVGNTNPACPKIVAPLLNAGYHVLLVDAQAHGERKRAWEDTRVLLHASLSGAGSDVLAAARAEATSLVDGALALGVTGETGRLAVVGQSWGGLQSLLTLAGDPRPACSVAIMPVTAITHLDFFADLDGAPRIVAGGPGAWMGPYLAPRPLLIIAGERDTVTPADHAEAFVAAIRPAYMAAGAGPQLAYTVLPAVAHEFDPQQVEATLAWLARHLALPGAAVTPHQAENVERSHGEERRIQRQAS